MTTPKNPALPTLRAAIYVRLSKENVRGKSLGIESTAVQHKDAREAIAREGWTFDERHVFVDDGVSGRRADRDGWLAALAAAKRGEFDVLVVRDQDRFSRQHAVDALVAIRDLAKTGVQLWSYAQRQFISVDGDHVLFTTAAARHAASRSEKDGESIAGGLRRRAREGRATGKAPFGYRTRIVTEQDALDASKAGDTSLRPGKWYVKFEPEVAVCRHVHALMCQHESYTGTIGELNADGTRPPKSRTWRPATVKMLLTQPLARGFRLYKGERIEQPNLRIFMDVEVKRIDAILKKAGENRPWSSKPRKADTFNLAVGFVACGVCGGTIVASGSHNRSYLCDRHRLKNQCRGIGYRSADRVDEALVRAVDATLTPEAISVVCTLVREEVESHPATREDNRERIEREIAGTEKRLEHLDNSLAEAPKPELRARAFAKMQVEMDRLHGLRTALAHNQAKPPELNARRRVANVQKRAQELRAMLAKGGRDAADAIRVVLGATRLKAHLVTVDGKRGWKLTGRIGGFYVFDEEHHGSDRLLKLAIKGNVSGVVVTPVTVSTSSPAPAAPTAPVPAATAPSGVSKAG